MVVWDDPDSLATSVLDHETENSNSFLDVKKKLHKFLGNHSSPLQPVALCIIENWK